MLCKGIFHNCNLRGGYSQGLEFALYDQSTQESLQYCSRQAIRTRYWRYFCQIVLPLILVLIFPSSLWAQDTTPPSFVSATVDGTILEVTFDENLASVTGLTNNAFRVRKTPSGGSEADQVLRNIPSVSGKTVTLILSSAVVESDLGTVKVTYTPPSATNAQLRDAAGNSVANFTDQKVLNLNGGICPRTDEVRDAILTQIRQITVNRIDCDEVTNSHLASIGGNSSINIGGTETIEPKSGDFDGLINLETLILDANGPTSLPEDLFDELSALTHLTIGGNALSNLQENLFSGLTSVQTIFISIASNLTVHEDLFDGLTNLERITLNTNLLGTLHEDLFDGLTNLERLYITSHSVTTLEADLFDGLTNLERLSIFSFSVTDVHEDLFDGLPKLDELSIGFSSLQNYHEDLFDGLTNLKKLTLSNVFVPRLHEDLFDGLSSLTELNIDSNSFQTLHPDLFDGISAAISVSRPNYPGFCVPNKIWQLENVTFTPSGSVVACSGFSIALSANPLIIQEEGTATEVTVTATLNDTRTSSTPLTVIVGTGTATAGTDFTPVSNFSISIPANMFSASGMFTLTPTSDMLHESDERVNITGSTTVNNLTVNGTSLTIIDDEQMPTATMTLSPTSITENAGTATITATLSHASGEATAILLTIEPVAPATDSDYTLSNILLLIEAGSTESSEAVTITAVDNELAAQDKTMIVKGSTVNSLGVNDPSDVQLTITDDDSERRVVLHLSSNSITENEESSTVTATLNEASSEVTTITVSVLPDTPATESDYTLSGNTLTIAAGETESTGTVTITSVGDNVDAPDRTVQVQGVVENTQGVSAPADVELTITDDDAAPTVTLNLSPTSTPENAGSSTVTATLNHPSSEATTITISVEPISPASDADYTLSGSTLTIAAGETASTGTVTITATDNTVIAPDKVVTVQGAASNPQGISGPADVELTITDNDLERTVTLNLSPTTISENDASTTVTATLSHASTEVTTITVTLLPDEPATESDVTLSGTTLTIAAGETASTGTVTITSVDNRVDAPDKTIQVQGTTENSQGVTGPSAVELTITDDEAAPTVTLHLGSNSISEDGERTTVTAMLSHPSSEETTITVSTLPDAPATDSDYTLSSSTLTIAAGETESTEPMMITAVNNGTDAPDNTVQVQGTATNAQGITGPEDVELTITDDEDSPAVTLRLSSSLIGEDGESTTVTAMLSHASSAQTTITVSVHPDAPATESDYTLSGNTLTIAAGATESMGLVTITSVTNNVDAPDKTFQVQGVAENPQGVTGPEDVELTITDGTAPPAVTLNLLSNSIVENAGTTTVTATLDRASSEETTIMVSVRPDSPATASDYTLNGNLLTIAAGETASTGTVTITAVNNLVDAPDRTVQVEGVAANTVGITQPNAVPLTITDDETAPAVTLSLASVFIGENAGSTTVMAMLSHASSEETTVTVSVRPDSPATASDYTLNGNLLTIAAGETASTGTVTITAVNNLVDAPNRTVQVEGEATNVQGATNPAAVELTITDDEAAPTVTLVVSPTSIGEDGESTTVTTTLSHASSAVTTITISGAAVSPAQDSDYTLTGNPLTIPAGATASTQTVTITAVDNLVNAPDKTVQVQGTATNVQGVTQPAAVQLTITDDDEPPVITLLLSPSSISENEQSTTVTATQSHASSAPTTIMITAVATLPALDTDYTLTGTVLTIEAGATESTGLVTITSVDNPRDAPDKRVTVQGVATNVTGILQPADVELTITDDEEAPTATLILSPASIGEDAQVSAVTATLSHASSEVTTIAISATALETEFTLSTNPILTIAAGAITSTGTVTITSVDDPRDAPDQTVQVQGVATNAQGVTGPTDVELTIVDNEDAPTVTLLLSPASIREDGQVSSVTATLSHPSSKVTTITVLADAVSPALDTDYTLSGSTLTIAAGETASTGAVTITSIDNPVSAPDKTVRVQGVATNTQGVTGPEEVELTILEDEAAPTVTLLLSPASIGETAASTMVTATLSHASSDETMITISASAVSPAVDTDYTLSGTTLTIAAGATTSTGTVTITSVDNRVDAPDKTVQVRGVAANDQGVTNPANVDLTITDDEDMPTVTLRLSSASIAENAGSTTVTAALSHPSSAVTTIIVSVRPNGLATVADYGLGGNQTLTIVAGETESTGLVTITAVDNEIDAPDKTVQVQGHATNVQGITGPAAVELTITDEDAAPSVTLVLSSPSIREGGERTTVTATLSRPSSEVTTVEVTALPDAPATGSDFVQTGTTLTISAGATSSTGLVTITSVDNPVDAPDKTVQVQGNATNTQGITDPTAVELTILDDDEAPRVTLLLSSSLIGEDGETTTITATLNRLSSEPTTVAVTVLPDLPATDSDYILSTNTTLTIAAGATVSTGRVTITSVTNDVDAPDKTIQIRGTSTNVQGVTGPTDVELTITDGTAPPAVTLVLSPTSIGENAGVTTVTAILNRTSSETTTIAVTVLPNAPATASDYTQSGSTLTIVAGATQSTGLVTITAVDNSVDAPDKTVQVQGSATNTLGITNPANMELTILDDEAAPTVTLLLSPTSISENAGLTTVTATLNRPSSEPTTIVVTARPDLPALGSDYTLSGTTLTIAAGETGSTGLVTITAVDNQVDAPDKTIQVQGTATNVQGVTSPTSVALTITDDEEAPTVSLVLSTASISEDGESTTVTATLDRPSGVVTAIVIAALPVAPALASDVALSGNLRLTIAAGETGSTGLVTIVALDNEVDGPDPVVQVQGTATNTLGVIGPEAVELTITDDDPAPAVTLLLSPASITENAGLTVVSASIDRPSSEVTTINLTTLPDAPATELDYSLSGNTLTILAGETNSTEEVTITAVDNEVNAPNKTMQVQGTATNVQGITGPADVELTILDDDLTPTVTLLLSPASIGESGGITTVTAALSRPSSEPTTIEMTVLPNAPATELDYTLHGTILTIEAGATSSTEFVTIMAVDNAVDAPDKTVQVQGIVTSSQGVTSPAAVQLTITDDEATPTVTLLLDPSTISEAGESTTVTAMLSHPSSAMTTVVISAVANPPAVASDLILSQNTILTIAAGATESTGLVTLTAVDNAVDEPDKTIQVQGIATNRQGVTVPADVVLTIADDDEVNPTVSLILTPASIAENDGQTTVTATIDPPSTAVTTIVVSVVPDAPATESDYQLSDNLTLTIATGETESTGLVTITAVDNEVSAPDKTVQVYGTATNPRGVTGPPVVELTITDDEAPPTVTLMLDPSTIDESGGRTTVTATLNRTTSMETRVAISVLPDAPATQSDYRLSTNTILTIAAGETESTGLVTITAVDNEVDAPDKTVQVQGMATHAQQITEPANVELTITDDEETPTVTLLLDPSTIAENGGVSTVTATQDRASSEETILTITVLPVAPATESDYLLSDNVTLTIAAGTTESTGLVSITGVDDEANTIDKTVQVQGVATNSLGITGPADVELVIAANEASPLVTLRLDPPMITEKRGITTVTATLDRASSKQTIITISVLPDEPTSESDYFLSDNITLTIAENEITSMGIVTIAAVDNEVDAPDKTVQVQGVATNSLGVTQPSNVELTINDDDETPAITLVLDPPTIGENGGMTTVTAILNWPSSAVTMVGITVFPNELATDSDYLLSENSTLTIAAGTMESTGLVTITAVDNEVDALDKTVQVQGRGTNAQGVTDPEDVILLITDDDKSFPVARDAMVTTEEDMPYPFSPSDFGYSDPEGDPLASIRVERHPDAGMLTLGRTGFAAGTEISVEQISAGELVFTPVANAYGSAYTSFDFKVSDGTSESLRAAKMTIDVTPVNDIATGQPQIIGSMQVGQLLRVSVEEIQDLDGMRRADAGESEYGYRYQWLRMEGSQSEPIGEGDTYVPVETDAGASLLVRVTFVDDAGFEERLESLPRQVRYTSRIRTAWMGRLGRTVADQVLRATQCEERIQRSQRNEVYLAGQPLTVASLPKYVRIQETKPDQFSTLLGNTAPVVRLGHTLTRERLLHGSSFQHGMQDGSGMAFWGHGAVSRVQGADGALNLEGRVSSGMLGADWSRDKEGLSVLVAHTRSEGEYTMPEEEGTHSAYLTGVYPNGCYAISSGVTAWGVVGYGRGSMTVEQVSAPVGLWMIGGGIYGRIHTVRKQGLEFGVRSDALMVQMSASETNELSKDQAQVTRLRVGLQGTMREIRLGTGFTMEPAAEVALRHDGGDAETGFGVDMQVGFILSAPANGLSMEVQSRAVLTHQDRGLQERGLAGAVTWDMQPHSSEGLEIRVEHTVGTDVLGGTEQMLRAETIQPQYTVHQTGDLRMQAGYGFALFSNALTLRPEVSLSGSGSQRRYEMGWNIVRAHEHPSDVQLFVGATGQAQREGSLNLQQLIRLQLKRQF